MNWQHFRAFLWLRWRLRINQFKRGGIANLVILIFLAVAAALFSVVLFVAFVATGSFALNEAKPVELMYVMDGAVIAYLFMWAAGLLTELQRSEALSLEKFLHLPVSLTNAFLINYLSSLPSVSLVWFSSAMLGLTFGLVYSRGLAMLWLVPMLAAFLLMVTALTYQFQGWLATLMANPRRRRTVIVLATMIFLLICQAPNVVNILHPWQNQTKPAPPWQDQPNPGGGPTPTQEEQNLHRDFIKGKISLDELSKRSIELEKRKRELLSAQDSQHRQAEKEQEEKLKNTVRLMNFLLPPGWLPAGLEAAAEGQAWPVLLAILGPALIGTASLWRAYRTTLRLYTGQYTSGTTAGASRPVQDRTSRPTAAVRAKTRLLERKLPWVSEQAAAITLAAFRSLLRAPEAKMLLLSPILLLVIFGSMFLTTGRADMTEGVRPTFSFGAMVVVLFSMSQLLGNQFGFDRDGFRVFVLSPARRRDILLGKNLAVAPIALTMGVAAAVLLQVVYPMRLDNFLALAPRFLSMYLLYCLVANSLSILVPMRIAPSSFQPAKPGGLVVLMQLLFMFLCPAILSLTLLPLLIELAMEEIGWRHGIPIDLLLSLVECAVIVYIYGLLLGLQGDWLQSREQRILQIVTTRAE